MRNNRVQKALVYKALQNVKALLQINCWEFLVRNILIAEKAINNQFLGNAIIKGILAIVVVRKNLSSIICYHWAHFQPSPIV